MTSDNERREAAERLKGYVSEWRDMPSFSVQKGVAYSLGIARFDVESQLLRLADLIEPDTTTDTTKSTPDTTKCDRDALLALADEIEDSDVTYCVSTQYVLDSYASRIRDALGVAEDAERRRHRW